MEISLRKVTGETVRSICDLSVNDNQRSFVAPNAVSIAQAYFYNYAWFRAIYADDKPVGFVMLSDRPELPEYFLWRFMVDKQHQKKGYGEKAIKLLVDYVKSRPKADVLWTSIIQSKGGPQRFYEKQGFKLTGEYKDGEALMTLDLA